MAKITVETIIAAPRGVCFDLARDMDVHEKTTGGTKERVVEIKREDPGRTGQLLELGDEVTFEAVHLGVRQRLTSKIVAFDRPGSFVDEMQKGAFHHLRHEHVFEENQSGTRMLDVVDFASPGWIFGRVLDAVFLSGYLRRFLSARGQALKRVAEQEPSRSSRAKQT